MHEHLQYTENVDRRLVTHDVDQTVQYLTQAGIETHAARLLAPMLVSTLQGYQDLLKMQHDSGADLFASLLKFYERSKNNNYIILQRNSGSRANAPHALREATRNALQESHEILEAKKRMDAAQLKNLEQMAKTMVETLQLLLGEKNPKGEEVIKSLLKDATVIEGQVVEPEGSNV